MASALHLMKSTTSGIDLGHDVTGLGGLLLDTGIEFAAGFGMGEFYHRYQDKWVGRNAPRIAAIFGKIGAIITALVTGGKASLLGGALNAIGSSGVTVIGLDLGLQHARAATGKQVVFLPKGATLPAGASRVTSIGELPPAPEGRGLSWAQLEELAAMH